MDFEDQEKAQKIYDNAGKANAKMGIFQNLAELTSHAISFLSL